MAQPSGAVAAGHPVTAAAAEEILREGGNAFDAVIAAAAAACVAEPVLASLAGGGFLLAHKEGAAPVVHDFFAQTPRRRRPENETEFYPVHADFGYATQEFHIGLGSVATPGVIAGLFDIHRRHGSLPMARLLEPAIRGARQGVRIEQLQSYIFDVVAPIYRASDGAIEAYGSLYPGRIHRQPDLAATLEALSREGPDLFYRGELGRRLGQLSTEQGGHLCAADLESYRVIHRDPLSIDYRGARIFTNPPPTAGGILIGFGLGLLEATTMHPSSPASPGHLCLLAEVLEATVAARIAVLAEAASSGELSSELLATYRERVAGAPPMSRGTTHISIIDEAGSAAALTLSNGEGCGHLIPGTGIMLNNMLGEEDINPDGFNAWPRNRRMTSMMAPTLVERDGRRIAMGSGGSNRIRSAILQVIVNLLDYRDDPATAVGRPRLHAEAGHLSIEGGFPTDVIDALLEAHPAAELWPDRNLFFGGVHLAMREAGGFTAAGDPRIVGIGLTL
jgi:gamma-glutamyltranspeptidase/glutathione hydrolase